MSHFILNNNAFVENRFDLGVTKLPMGSYRAFYNPMLDLWSFEKQETTTDKLLEINSESSQKIIDDISFFIKNETKDSYKRYGFLYRRAVLMYGSPGTGKSMTVKRSLDLIKDKAIILYMDNVFNPKDWKECIEKSRVNNSDALVVLVLEEFDQVIDEGYEPELIEFLDGKNTCGNLYIIATTNFKEKLPPRIIERPSRIAISIKVDLPKTETRLQFLKSIIKKEDLGKFDLPNLVKNTNGFSIDHLKDIVISVCVFNLSQEEALQKITNLFKDS